MSRRDPSHHVSLSHANFHHKPPRIFRSEACRGGKLHSALRKMIALPYIRIYNNKWISFDSAKREKNLLTRGLSFALAAEFEWDSALIVEDLRKDYGERRFQALGLIGDRLHMMVFTPRQQCACD